MATDRGRYLGKTRPEFFRVSAKFLRGEPMSSFPPVIGTILEHAAGTAIAEHCHPCGQLAVVMRGTMALVSAEGLWLAPPGRGVWVPTAMFTRLLGTPPGRLLKTRAKDKTSFWKSAT